MTSTAKTIYLDEAGATGNHLLDRNNPSSFTPAWGLKRRKQPTSITRW